MPATPTPEQYQPRLTWRSHAWRLALCLVVSTLAWSNSWRGQWHDHRLLFWIDLGVGLIAFGLCLLRRRWPFGIALVLAALGAVSAFSAGPAILAAVSFASRRQFGRILALGVLVVIASQAYADTQPVSPQSGFHVGDSHEQDTTARSSTSIYLDLVGNVLFTSAVLGWGMYIGSRRELLWTLRETAREAESERDLRVASARTTERTRIAREMHDVLAHRISQVSMQAGAMAYREDLNADELRAGAQLIETQANQALTELRGVLGVLRSPETGELLDRPQPTYADVDALIEESRQGGMNVQLDDQIPEHAEVPTGAGRTIFRIVQEGLTNANKHAPGALVRIELSGSPEAGIDVVLRNAVGFASTPAAPGSGLGLIGLTERTALRGGRLEHRREGSMFVLHGWIPWAA